ncbi:MAG: hypothetical protein ACOYBQ_10225 [Fluviibacter sp.]
MATRQIRSASDDGDPEHWGVTDPNETGQLIAPEEIEVPETPLDRIASFLGATGMDARAEVRLWRIKDGHSHKIGWCKNYTAKEFEEGGDLALIRNEWGSGDYQLRLFGVRNGRLMMVGKEDVEIVADRNATAAPVMHQNSELSMMLKSMADNQAAMMQALAQRPDPMAGMAQAFGLMAQMREAMGINPAVQQGGGKSQLSEIVGAIRELREVSAEINPPPPPADESGGLLPMGMQVMEMVKATMDAKRQEAQLHPAPLPMIHAPQSLAFPPVVPIHETISVQGELPGIPPAPQSPEQIPPAGTEDMNFALLLLRGYLQQVIKMAANKAPVSDAAELLYEKMPDEAIDMLQLPQWFDLLCTFEPNCKDHAAYFGEAHAMILGFIAEDATAEDATAEAQDSAPGTGPVATPSKPG